MAMMRMGILKAIAENKKAIEEVENNIEKIDNNIFPDEDEQDDLLEELGELYDEEEYLNWECNNHLMLRQRFPYINN